MAAEAHTDPSFATSLVPPWSNSMLGWGVRFASLYLLYKRCKPPATCYLDRCRYVLHDRDTKFCASFRSVLAEGGVKTIPHPARSPNLNAFAERWVRSAKQECFSKLILFGEDSLLRTLTEFGAHRLS